MKFTLSWLKDHLDTSASLDEIADMRLLHAPHEPTWPELQQKARFFPPKDMHEDWVDYVLPKQRKFDI